MTGDAPREDPFDVEAFRRFGHADVERLAEHDRALRSRDEPFVRLPDPAALLVSVPPLEGNGGGDPLALLEGLPRVSNRIHHPPYVLRRRPAAGPPRPQTRAGTRAAVPIAPGSR